MNILSLFDGMSCGQQALNRAGIKYDKYFASEIDKYAIKVTQENFPNTIQLGSVVNLNTGKLPKIDLLIGGSPCQSFSFAGKRKGMSTKDSQEVLTLEHYLELKSEGYEFEGQSYLFWEYMRILKEVNPKYFLLENVQMSEKWERVLSKAIGVNPIKINSSLVSAQNRIRLYWTNIGMVSSGLFGDPVSIIEQPKERGILLKDILESEVNEKYFLSEKIIKYFIRAGNEAKKQGNGYKWTPTNGDKKSTTIVTKEGSRIETNFIVHNTMPRSGDPSKGGTGPLSRTDGKTYCLDTGNTNAVEIKQHSIITHNVQSQVKVRTHNVDIEGLKILLRKHKNTSCRDISQKLNIPLSKVEHWFRTDESFSIPDSEVWFDLKNILNIQTTEFDSQVTEFEIKDNEFEKSNRVYDEEGKAATLTLLCGNDKILQRNVIQLNDSTESCGKQPYQQNRIYDDNGISPTLDSRSVQKNIYTNSRIRRLTPTECERLQTVEDGYTNHVSDTQRYKMLGNGWTVDVIVHIFSYIQID